MSDDSITGGISSIPWSQVSYEHKTAVYKPDELEAILQRMMDEYLAFRRASAKSNEVQQQLAMPLAEAV
ncbi:MAG: hypothetical protein WC565_04670 [Parcubacteria group bacterium]